MRAFRSLPRSKRGASNDGSSYRKVRADAVMRIGDTDFNVSKLYGMLGADVSGDPADRTAVDNQTVRTVFVIGPERRSR